MKRVATLTMKSVGEVKAIGRVLLVSLQKAHRFPRK
jgi:carbamoylphosphate synthase large subunit